FPQLPYLTYRQAMGLVALWGLLFLLVLTMISGARELMTPGAWKKQGFTYTLAAHDPTAASATAGGPHEVERRHALDRLRAALWTYARHHGGRFPTEGSSPEIPADVWQVPDPSDMRYVYQAGLLADRGAAPLAYEPGLYGGHRLVLLTSGVIVRMAEA